MTARQVRRVLRFLPVLLRGRPLHGAERFDPFFIVGSGRCGSTLLRAMLVSHPDVHIPPELGVDRAVRDYRRYSRLPWYIVLRITLGVVEFSPHWEQFGVPLGPLVRELQALPLERRNLATVLDALYRTHAAVHKPQATRWGDKTPVNAFYLGSLQAVFPDLKVIHLVRDGRDVVYSWMRTGRADLPLGASLWLRAVRAACAFGERHPSQYQEVRYEDLVRDPRPVLERLATFIGIGFDDRMLRHHELDLPLGDVRLPFHDRVRRPLHQEAVGRWRSVFDAAQVAQLESLLGPTLATLGYPSSAASAEGGTLREQPSR
jgi:hypothetical protein